MTYSSGRSLPGIRPATFGERLCRISFRTPAVALTPSGTGLNPRFTAAAFRASRSWPASSTSWRARASVIQQIGRASGRERVEFPLEDVCQMQADRLAFAIRVGREEHL